MRFILMTAAVSVVLAQSPAFAAQADIDPATLAAVTALATSGYDDPASAEVTNVRKSLAMNGKGYCGEVSVEGADGTVTTFHALLETANGASVLRLADYPDPEKNPPSATVERLLRNFGCLK